MSYRRTHEDSTPDPVQVQTNIGGDIYTDGGSVNTGTIYNYATPPASLPPFDFDPTPLPPPAIFVGRQEELLILQETFARVQRTGSGRLVAITGPAGIGKRTLIHQWLADLRDLPQPPIIAETTFVPPYLPTDASAAYYRDHPAWRLAGEQFGPDLARFFPTAFRLGNQPWLALAAQLAAQSAAVRAFLARREPLAAPLRHDLPAHDPQLTRALNELIRLAAGDGPLILVFDKVQRSDVLWLTLLQSWLTESRAHQLPCLFLVTHDYPDPFTAHVPDDQLDLWVRWLRDYTNRAFDRGDHLFLAPLHPDDVALLLEPNTQPLAAALHYLTTGVPDLIRRLFAYWQTQGLATLDSDGRWGVTRRAPDLLPGDLYDDLISAPIQAAADRADEWGLSDELFADLLIDQYGQMPDTASRILQWLSLAVWEGDFFTADALAHAVGCHRSKLVLFYELLDDTLVQSTENSAGLLEEVPEIIELPEGDGERRQLRRYRFVLPVIAAILRQRQDQHDRRQAASTYAQGLLDAYVPHTYLVDTPLAQLYHRSGFPELAQPYIQRLGQRTALHQEEFAINLLRTLARDEHTLLELLKRMLQFIKIAWGQRTAEFRVNWLASIISLAQRLNQPSFEAEAHLHLAQLFTGNQVEASALTHLTAARQLDLAPFWSAIADLIEGQIMRSRRQFDQAEHLFCAALSHGRAANNLIQSLAYLELGVLYREQRQWTQSEQYLNDSLNSLRAIGDNHFQGHAQAELGILYRKQKQLDKAKQHLLAAIPLFHTAGVHCEAHAHRDLGILYRQQAQWKQAEHHLQAALTLDETIGDVHDQGKTLREWAVLHREQTDNAAALVKFDRAIALFATGNYPISLAIAHRELAVLHHQMANYGAAETAFTDALTLLQAENDPEEQAKTHSAFAPLLTDLGRHAEAEAQLAQAAALTDPTQKE